MKIYSSTINKGIIIILVTFMVVSCKKDELTVETTVETGSIDEVESTKALAFGRILSIGQEVIQYGHCWSTISPPTIEGNRSDFGSTSQTGLFSSQITELLPGEHYYYRAYIATSSGIFYGALKSFNTPDGKAAVSTGLVTEITTGSAKCSGSVTSAGGDVLMGRGICWDTIPQFSLQNCIGSSNSGAELGDFAGLMIDLTPGASYYVKAYAFTRVDTTYGALKELTTLDGLAVITTSAVSQITGYSAYSGGEITDDGGAGITARGICWSIQPDPDLQNNEGVTTDGTGIGPFISELTGLQHNTKYYIRAYATNDVQTTYGNQEEFSTLGEATITTEPVHNIQAFTAQTGGIITNNGGAPITTRGVCWGTQIDPTLENSDGFTMDGSGTGDFNSELSNLQPGTAYYVRAYATNSVGTAYGNQLVFTSSSGMVTMATKEISGITSSAAQSGGQITDDGGAPITVRGICWGIQPEPNLQSNLGMTTDGSGVGDYTSNLNGLEKNTTYYVRAYATNGVGTFYGNQKIFSTIGEPVLITQSIGSITAVSAVGGGTILDDGGASITARGICWGTQPAPDLESNDGFTFNGTGTGSFTANMTGLEAYTDYFVRAYATNSVGTSYGNEVVFTTRNGIVVLSTQPVVNITTSGAESGGEITDDGGAAIISRGICWGNLPNPDLQNNVGFTNDGSGAGYYASSMTGLESNTQYYVRAYATNSVGTYYGAEYPFTTEFLCGGSIIDPRDGTAYTTVQIGDQCWFSENLNIGTMISDLIDQTNNGLTEKYCYDNNESNCDIYGGLYLWDEMMDYQASDNGNPGTSEGICPDGWHLATEAEWQNLEIFLGMDPNTVLMEGWRGDDEGGQLKTTGTTYWLSPNTGATDAHGFSALPGGRRNVDGGFQDLGIEARFWTATEGNTSNAWYRGLANASSLIGRNNVPKMTGRSVRCIKDQ
jgi:uncharacterized protein (TIGR02145 family)